jgi:SPW repeat
MPVDSPEHGVILLLQARSCVRLLTGKGKTMKPLKHWQDSVNLVRGAWLLLSPWVLGYSPIEVATVTAVITGAAILVLAMGTLATDPDCNAWLGEHRAH